MLVILACLFPPGLLFSIAIGIAALSFSHFVMGIVLHLPLNQLYYATAILARRYGRRYLDLQPRACLRTNFLETRLNARGASAYWLYNRRIFPSDPSAAWWRAAKVAPDHFHRHRLLKIYMTSGRRLATIA